MAVAGVPVDQRRRRATDTRFGRPPIDATGWDRSGTKRTQFDVDHVASIRMRDARPATPGGQTEGTDCTGETQGSENTNPRDRAAFGGGRANRESSSRTARPWRSVRRIA